MPHNSLKAALVPDSKTNIAFSANGIHIDCVSEEELFSFRFLSQILSLVLSKLVEK
jgi:vancomycin resistance protein YoaR